MHQIESIFCHLISPASTCKIIFNLTHLNIMAENNAKTNDADIQQRAFAFACQVVKLYRSLAASDYGTEALARQLLRSATSVGANLEEASAAQSRADFIHRCNIALKEARETWYWIRLFVDTKVVAPERLADLADESNQLVAILTTIVKNARTSDS